MNRYDPKTLEPKWQKIWQESGLYKTDMSRTADKFYIIPMLPYPSGDLHVGHWYNFGPTDTAARFRRMLGQNVLSTIGFDAFGLPAENAAISRGIQPAKWTRSNIASMTTQIEQIGAGYDWGHTLATCDPSYYRWNQWLFLQLYKKGLAYRAKAVVNWCPKDKTVLANEQVVGDNSVCERCGTPVIQKEMESWYFKITDYTERLLTDLEKVDWPNKVKVMQQNWIGKSQGALVKFRIADEPIKHFVLLHGKGGSTNRNFLPWLKDELEAQGFSVDSPELPNSKNPNDDEQAEYVKKHCQLGKNTAVIGHSFGGIVALRLLESGVKLGSVTLVGTPYSSNFLDGKHRPTVAAAVNKGFKFNVIKKNCPDFTALYDLGDYVVPVSDGKAFAAGLNCPLVEVHAQEGHFTANQEPEILRTVGRAVDAFTTRPDTIFGASFLVLAPEHQILNKLNISNEAEKYIGQAKRKTELERKENEKKKTGVFTGVYAVNPATGQNIPIWVADYVLMGYGTGAIMAVPAHDERDYDFAKKYSLPIVRVIEGGQNEDPYSGEGELVDSGKYSGQNSAEARDQMAADFGSAQTNYRLRDWLISRQRYWGTPIPIIYCDKCGVQTVPESDLPVVLPEDVEFTPAGRNPLLERGDFVDTKCPNCGKPAKRETDTMDTFVDSSWYFLRYLDNRNEKAAFNPEIINAWGPVDHYIGGIEHAILHLLYARFITKFLHDNHGLKFDEPFKKLTNQGIILGPDGQKMSKSRGNVVSPDEQVGSYGADSLRLYLMFMGPYEQGGPYSLSGIVGTRRFLDRVWTLVADFNEGIKKEGSVEGQAELNQELKIAMHSTIRKVTEDLENLQFNTAIATLMDYTNVLYQLKEKLPFGAVDIVWTDAISNLIKLLAPFAPHISEELWQKHLSHRTSVHLESWPRWAESVLKGLRKTIAIMVNGKTRDTFEIVPESHPAEEIIRLAQNTPKIKSLLKGKSVKKSFYVPGRLVSLVVE